MEAVKTWASGPMGALLAAAREGAGAEFRTVAAWNGQDDENPEALPLPALLVEAGRMEVSAAKTGGGAALRMAGTARLHVVAEWGAEGDELEAWALAVRLARSVGRWAAGALYRCEAAAVEAAGAHGRILDVVVEVSVAYAE